MDFQLRGWLRHYTLCKAACSDIGQSTAIMNQMGQSAVFFDRDNTLIINDGYLGDPAQVVLMPGAADAVAAAREMGFAVVTVSNQSGVARGLFDEAAVQAVDKRMDELLASQNNQAVIDLHVYCPFHPEAIVAAYRQKSDLRKPEPGMILLAAEQLKLDLKTSWLIGDAPRDVEAGKRAGCRTILFIPPGVEASPAAKDKTVVADAVVLDLKEAMEFMKQHLSSPTNAGV